MGGRTFMSRPIIITPDLYDKILEDVRKKLEETKSANGKFTYSCDFQTIDDRKTEVCFTPTAWIKMTSLVREYVSEVGWHGIAERTENGFLVSDIIMYPQTVTGSTVTTDQEELGKWIADIDENKLKKIRFHGHSHVNFGVTPSSVDMEQRQQFLGQLGADDFYIFMIINKKGDATMAVYDLRDNMLYDTKDIAFCVCDVEEDTLTFVDDTKNMVKTHSYAQPAAGTAKTAASQPAKGKKTAKKSDPKNYDIDSWLEERDKYYGYGYGLAD